MTLDLVVKDIANTVKESVSDAFKSVSDKYDAKIKELEGRIDAIHVPDSVDVDYQKIEQIIDDKFKSIPVPENGKDGADGKDGVDGDNGKDGVDGKDGKDGADGANGSDGVDGKDGISPEPELVAKAMEHHFAKWALDFERMANEKFEKALSSIPRPKDAIEIKDFDIQLGDDMRTVTVSLGDISKQIKLNSILDKGVFKMGSTYQAGDAVTYGGSLWIAQKDNNGASVPNDSDEWRLAVKRGRDGKEVIKLDKPETVKV